MNLLEQALTTPPPPKPEPDPFRLLLARCAANKTQAEAQEAIGWKRGTGSAIAAIEAGTRPVSAAVLHKLALAYGVTSDDLTSLPEQRQAGLHLLAHFRATAPKRTETLQAFRAWLETAKVKFPEQLRRAGVMP